MRFGRTFRAAGTRGAAFRTVRRTDRAVPARLPGAQPATGSVEIRVWRRSEGGPLLLATASRKQGSAVARNRFRRRVRHAFLALFQEGYRAPAGLVVWVRPGRHGAIAGRIPFTEILGRLRRALSSAGVE